MAEMEETVQNLHTLFLINIFLFYYIGIHYIWQMNVWHKVQGLNFFTFRLNYLSKTKKIHTVHRWAYTVFRWHFWKPNSSIGDSFCWSSCSRLHAESSRANFHLLTHGQTCVFSPSGVPHICVGERKRAGKQ